MIITFDDIRKHRPIALNLDDEKRLKMYIDEAETLDVMPALGAELYKSVTDNPNNHATLLEGGYYDNDKKYFKGLKAAVSLLAYGRFILNNAVNATPFGVQRKSALDSEPVDDKTLFRHANEARNAGLAYLNQCLEYLNTMNEPCRKNTGRTAGKKINVIGS